MKEQLTFPAHARVDFPSESEDQLTDVVDKTRDAWIFTNGSPTGQLLFSLFNCIPCIVCSCVIQNVPEQVAPPHGVRIWGF